MEFSQAAENARSIQSRIDSLSRRDFQLWTLSALVAIILTVGVVAVFVPVHLEHFPILHSPGRYFPMLFLGLIVLVVLFNVYLIQQRRELEATRQQLIDDMLFNQRMQNMTLVDPLTQVFNRRYLDHVIPKEVNRANRHRTPLCFLLIDVAGFRNLNARFGHLEGDHALTEVAQILQKTFAPNDTVVRYSGGEFLVIMPDHTEPEADERMALVNAELKAWNDASQAAYKLQLAHGISAYVLDADVKDVLHTAELNLQQQKKDLADGQAQGRSMRLECLILSRDEGLVKLLRPLLESMGIGVETFDSGSAVLAAAAKRHVDGMVIDCALDEGLDVFEILRDSPSARCTTFIAVTERGQAGLAGTKFTLERPLYRSMCARTLRVARSLMLADRRRYFRHPVDMIVAIETGEGAPERCSATNVSDGGMAVQSDRPLRAGSSCTLKFILPGQATEVMLYGEVAWADSAGRAGIRFTDIPRKARSELDQWLAEGFAPQPAPA
jgi:diguanylate cyclase (GGDEF)-like protein